MNTMLKRLLFALVCCGPLALNAQFAPGVGIPGTSAMHKDSLVFVSWASEATLDLGPQQIGVENSPLASAGLPEYCLGKAGENPTISLGDGGLATLRFLWPVRNGEGWDFAVFENSFDGAFLELGFVEVSSDGINFFRFPATSHTDTAGVGSFELIDPVKINNLAGKYQSLFGTPFDLQELAGISGLDVNSISHVRVVDVIGTVQPQWCTRDAGGRKVADPWPTAFPGCGFDLDAVGVIHDNNPAGIQETGKSLDFTLFPQPATEQLTLHFQRRLEDSGMLRLFSISGTPVYSIGIPEHSTEFKLDLAGELPAGIYVLEFETNGIAHRRLCSIR